MTKAGMFYNDTIHLLNNKDEYIMVKDSRYLIPQVQVKKKDTPPAI